MPIGMKTNCLQMAPQTLGGGGGGGELQRAKIAGR
jgi:hypothetical protein